MKIPIYKVDTFTDKLFSGNPAAVIVTETELPADTMQSIAAENNLSETAFVVPDNDKHNIRWFTPTVEVDLCGHATLAAAHVLFNYLAYSDNKITFSSKSGLLFVKKAEGLLFLDFPADTIHKVEPEENLVKALNVTPIEVYRGRDDYLVIVEHESTVRSLRPNLTLLSTIPSRGVIVSSIGDQNDFVSRFFAPQSGVPEDPVTGSAHTTLTPYWAKKLNKKRLVAGQLSSRGGELICRDLGDRVEIGGNAVTYLIGAISL